MDEPVVEILFFEACPNHRPSVDLACEALRDLGLTVSVQEIEISTDEDARSHRFLGSPSIRVNGEDIEPEARDRTDYAMSCRMYGRSGLPPKELLVAASDPDRSGSRRSVSPELERAIRAWESTYDGLSQEALDARVRGFKTLVNAIADGRAVSRDEFAAELGIPASAAAAAFEGLAATGMQFDARGDLVGAALTPNPTPHHFRVRGRKLFAWCALDTLFLPGLLHETATVESSCPASGETIRLELTPGAILERQPEDISVTVVVPGASASAPQTGPANPT